MTAIRNFQPMDKPLIAILMAVHEPAPGWLSEQLASLEAQKYLPLHLPGS